jgi:hypothetical protein
MEIIESKQREQLIQLYYASKCAKSKECLCKNNECNKYFFGHIMHCREKECTISQCISSRNIFSHFNDCKNKLCVVCIPVKKYIIKDKEKDAINILLSLKNNNI